MSWIRTVPPAEAEGELQGLYASIASARGDVADVHRVQSLNPRAMRAHFELYRALLFQRSSLDRRSRERIGVVVSAANGCAYCVAHHGEALRSAGEESETVAALQAGDLPAGLGPAEHAVLAWAHRIARAPDRCSEADVQGLRAAGLDDRAILDAALTAAYFAFVNRLVLALGVEVEEDFARTCKDGDETGGIPR